MDLTHLKNGDAGSGPLSIKVQFLQRGQLRLRAPPCQALLGERAAQDVITALGQGTRRLARGTQCSARNQMENGRMVQAILCVGLKGEELQFQIGVGDLGLGGPGGLRQKWLPGGEAFGNWQGSLGALPRDGRRQEGGNWVQVTTEQQLGQGVEEEGLAGAWAAAPQLGFKGRGGRSGGPRGPPLLRPWESTVFSGRRLGSRAWW